MPNRNITVSECIFCGLMNATTDFIELAKDYEKAATTGWEHRYWSKEKSRLQELYNTCYKELTQSCNEELPK